MPVPKEAILDAMMKQQNIGAPVEFGRPIMPNPDGSVSTERTMTTQGPNGGWFNVPTMMNGAAMPQDTVDTLFQYGLVPHVGEFPTLDTAIKAAEARTKVIRR